MKSMLHEASSIMKAIEKAWNESGKPAEFTVKILEEGERNFLGMSKRPAIVSITYTLGFNADKGRARDFGQSRQFKKPQEYQKPNGGEVKREGFVPRNEPKVAARRVEPKVNARAEVNSAKADFSLEKNTQAENEIQSWNAEMSSLCADNLKEIMALLKIGVTFTDKINGKNLIITFDKSIVDSVAEDLKSFFASLAHILMQLLKRKYRKRFRGIQIIINHTASNDISGQNRID